MLEVSFSICTWGKILYKVLQGLGKPCERRAHVQAGLTHWGLVLATHSCASWSEELLSPMRGLCGHNWCQRCNLTSLHWACACASTPKGSAWLSPWHLEFRMKPIGLNLNIILTKASGNDTSGSWPTARRNQAQMVFLWLPGQAGPACDQHNTAVLLDTSINFLNLSYNRRNSQRKEAQS